MNSKEFKPVFDKVAQSNDFIKAFGGWFKESPECIVVLDLQKSNYGDYYELNIKIFVQEMFGNKYIMNKELVKKHTGDIFTRQPAEYNDVFDFDQQIKDVDRNEKLKKLFSRFIDPFTDKALSRVGIKQLADKGDIFLLPAIKNELYKR